MAYDSTSLALHSAQIGRSHSTGGVYIGGNVWHYRSSADGTTTVCASSYFTDGHKRGMRKYDTVMFMDLGSTLQHWLMVTAVTTGAGATVTDSLSSA